MKLDDFNYELPSELIAQTPSEKRDECRLMVLNRNNDSIEHRYFYDILDYLNPCDCLVLNDSKVIPARLYGTKAETGAHIEILLIKRIEGDKWEALVKPGKRLHDGDVVVIDDNKKLSATILGIYNEENATRLIEFDYEGIFMERLEEVGSMPLPPYIDRPSEELDKEMYQTVYSRIDGSVAAPTAGLHFTNDLLAKAEEKGVKLAYVTLHVGIGTFRPVKCENIEDHKMHFEECTVSKEAADIINSTIENCGKIIAVGTTSTRTVESMAEMTAKGYRIRSGDMSTGIFIYPGYKFKIINSLITNFHLPKSTLLMLISALYDREKVLEAYNVAVNEKYRFFSYGDAMLIE